MRKYVHPTLIIALFFLTISLCRAQTNPDPVVRWTFDTTNTIGTWQGKANIKSAGLHGPRYPHFDKQNRSAYFKTGLFLRIKETNLPDKLRFTTGDTITLEAWVKLLSLRNGQHAYIIGKGRNGNGKYAKENQGFAVRLTADKGRIYPSFLFRSKKDKNRTSDFHRWTANEGFITGTGWHHVVVTYTFGKSDSLRGYLDGKQIKGKWDLGGATDRAPVSDADDVLLGASQNGKSNAFHGWMDEVAVYRQPLPETVIAKRAERVPYSPKINVADLPKGKIRVEIIENGIPQTDSWPEEIFPAGTTYQADAFAFFKTPNKYIDTGIIADRPNPHMLRAMALITLPKGKHRMLLRGLGACRLWIDGKAVLQTSFRPPPQDAHHSIPTDYLDLAPDFRFKQPGNRETWTHFESPGKQHLVLLETIIGAKKGNNYLRPELGETVVAISPEGEKSFVLLAPQKRIAYTDAGWQVFAESEEKRIAELNKQSRVLAMKSQADYWQKRRKAAQQWLQQTDEVIVPELAKGYPAHNDVDLFLARKMAEVVAQKESFQGKIDFHKQIKPILQARCFSCHQGKKVRGGLGLDSRKRLLAGGDSGETAVVPKHPEKSLLFDRITTKDKDEAMPPRGKRLTKDEVVLIRAWIKEGAIWPAEPRQEVKLTPLTDDLTFLRRVYLDTIGLVPTPEDVDRFLKDDREDKRARLIDQLLNDPRWADHWVSYWQDALAENPNILNPTLNNTGPFRWWIYEAMLDNKPMDMFVTELIGMRGSKQHGGPAGFAMASQNDVPMAQKGIIVSGAFLGVTMKCARCHDAPAHESKQEDLFQLASLMAQKNLKVPKTSSVPQDKLHKNGRKALIQVTLKPGSTVKQAWPFPQFVQPEKVQHLLPDNPSARDKLAALVTAPQNERFAQVLANRLWARLMGRGLVEPIDDWEHGQPSHPELLRWLGRELVRSGYDFKHLARIILNSHAYQRSVDSTLTEVGPLFTAPAKRRLSAEQIVDSLFHAAGKKMDTEEINLDVDSGRAMSNSMNLGVPKRAWEFSSTSNERDRPSLSLPRVQAVVDVLQAFGWRGARQDPRSVRDTDPNVLQPAILANGPVGTWLTRLSDDHAITRLSLQDQAVEQLVDQLFLKILTRAPTSEEREAMSNYLRPGFDSRLVKNPPPPIKPERKPPRYVSWSNHLSEEANEIKIELDAAARRGAPPTNRLTPQWRRRMEDVVWALLNSPEFVFRP